MKLKEFSIQLENDKEKKYYKQYFEIAGITICVISDLDFERVGFKKELLAFSVENPGKDTFTISHHFGIPNIEKFDLGREIYNHRPWAIYKNDDYRVYVGILQDHDFKDLWKLAVLDKNLTHLSVFNPIKSKLQVSRTGFSSLSLFPTDQIWLCELLPQREAVLIHSGAAVVDGKGMMFIGHSGAGKSTTMEILKAAREKNEMDVTILCDDRNVVRRQDKDWILYGTWSHGTTEDVSPSSAPLEGLFFLEQANRNEIISIQDKKHVWKLLFPTLIRSMQTVDWMNKEMDILERIIEEVPAYLMRFDRSGAIVKEINKLHQI